MDLGMRNMEWYLPGVQQADPWLCLLFPCQSIQSHIRHVHVAGAEKIVTDQPCTSHTSSIDMSGLGGQFCAVSATSLLPFQTWF